MLPYLCALLSLLNYNFVTVNLLIHDSLNVSLFSRIQTFKNTPTKNCWFHFLMFFFNPSDCLCDIYGTVNPNVCDVEVAQRCTCKEGHTGADCSHCLDDFYRPSQEEVCKACKCNSQGSDSTCDRYEIRRFIDSRLNLILNRGMVILSWGRAGGGQGGGRREKLKTKRSNFKRAQLW